MTIRDEDLPADDEGPTADDDESSVSAAELIGRATYEQITERPARVFQQWHRPRKQFVRRSQWVASVNDLFTGRDPTDRVNYLGLPGTDLLDLRLLHESICIPQNRPLRFLGFHTGISPGGPESINLDISLQQLRLRDLVHEASQVLHDDFRKIGSGESRAFQEARRAAPYDVINLDLCSGIAADAPQSLDSYYNALSCVMALQQRLNPWVLLITTRISRDVINNDTAAVLHELFKTALSCEGFPEVCIQYFDADDLYTIDIGTCSEHDYFMIIAIGFCIWIFKLAQETRPQNVSVKAAFYYRVYPELSWADMLALAIRFTPYVVAPTDPSGLAVAGEAGVRDCDAAIQFANRFAKVLDVDERIRGDAKLRLELIDETARLLVEVGYEEIKYREWVEQYES